MRRGGAGRSGLGGSRGGGYNLLGGLETGPGEMRRGGGPMRMPFLFEIYFCWVLSFLGGVVCCLNGEKLQGETQKRQRVTPPQKDSGPG
jgi:hypothetical protein